MPFPGLRFIADAVQLFVLILFLPPPQACWNRTRALWADQTPGQLMFLDSTPETTAIVVIYRCHHRLTEHARLVDDGTYKTQQC
jgi:hypothetical protein